MTTTIRLILSLLIAALAYAAATLLAGADFSNIPLLLCFVAATALTALLPAAGRAGTTNSVARDNDSSEKQSRVPAGASREEGAVKWFNVSKGFGFIIREGGEEIFVHFRSIRGDGRRSLRDGQRVDFVVGNSAKGPQAEDVVALD
ncbi:hypothetical protein GCM10027297_01790 [Parahaliea aestuarii]